MTGKQTRHKILLSIIFCYSLLIPSPILALPFGVGEKLEFSLSWMGIPAGTATMNVEDMTRINGGDTFHIVLRSWSNDFISTFYKVDDQIDGYVNANNLSSAMLKVRQREGRHKHDKEIVFNRREQKAIFTKNGTISTHDVPAAVHDSLSAFYFLRAQELKMGADLRVDIFTDGKLYDVAIKVIARERIDTEAGAFDTIKIRPLIKQNDVFNNRGKIYIWLTDDEYRMPVMVKTKIKIGHIKAELTKFERGGVYADR